MPFFCIHLIWMASFTANVLDSGVSLVTVGKDLPVRVSLIRNLNGMSASQSVRGFRDYR